MTLHEAIYKLLKQTAEAKTARQIADELNKNQWYKKRDGSEISTRQILARVDDHHDLFKIDRSISPLQIKIAGESINQLSKTISIKSRATRNNETVAKLSSPNTKNSFDPISDADTTILILGSLPGDTSLKLNEYYGDSRNRFWKIISTITNNNLPQTYSEKKQLLLNAKIGIWDVAHKANRKGSLDSDIEQEEPNDLEDFITRHKNLKIIGFNGKKSEALFDLYFYRKKDIIYISLPSTSSANQGINFDNICKLWRNLF